MTDAKKRISFQQHFHDLVKKSLKIIKKPIDTDDMQTFQLTKMSKIKQMLDMNKVSFVAGAFSKTAMDVTPTEELRQKLKEELQQKLKEEARNTPK